MKKAFQISLAGTLFTIEEDAYARLGSYLESVRAHFAGTEGADEIVRDIEARAAEQLIESGKAIITMHEVEAVIASMGKVEDFGDEGNTSSGSSSADQIKTERKKLYRDTGDMILGGVCSGLGHFFGIDALWVRIAFVIFGLSTGFGILVYVIMWAVTPEAKTASQKLEMSGSPVNLGTISESVKDKIEDAGDKVGATAKKASSKIYAVLAWPFDALKAVLAFLRKRILPLIGRIFQAIIAIATFIALLAVTTTAMLAIVHGPSRLFDVPLVDVMPLSIFYGTVGSAYLVLALPLLFVFLLSACLLRNRAMKVGISLCVLWFLAVSMGGAFGTSVADRVNRYVDTNEVFAIGSRDIALAGPITNVEARDGVRLVLMQGPVAKLTIEGRERRLDAFKSDAIDGTLSLSMGEGAPFCVFCDLGTVEATLVLPNVASISAMSGSRVTADTWNSVRAIEVRIADGSRGDLSIDAPSMAVLVKNGSRLTLSGTIASSTLSARSGSRIDADNAVIMNARATARDGSRITVSTDIASLIEDEDDGSRIDRAATSTDPYSGAY